MAENRGIPGTAVFITVVGFVIAYSGLKNHQLSETVRSFLKGEVPPDNIAISGIGSVTGKGNAGSAAAGAPPPSVATGPAFSTISRFLRTDMHFNLAAASGILGNMQVESGFKTTAFNPGEGAIGLCQWEHGRRIALQSYAAAHNLSETDLAAQLGYLRLELSTGFAHVRLQLLTVPNTEQGAANAAATWDAEYEISSGEARQQRMSNAMSIFRGGG